MNRKLEWALPLSVILVIAVLLLPSYFRIFENFELATLDLRFLLRPAQPQNEDIVIIEIANDTLEKIGRWPLKRDWYSAMIDILSAYGARAIIFDTLFSEKTEEDDLLIESTRNAGNVYYGLSFDISYTKSGGILEADRVDTDLLSGLKENSRGYGFINVIPDRDGKTRRAPLKIRYKGRIYPHLALLAAAEYLGKGLNEIDIPLGRDSYALINFAGRWEETFRHYSFVDIIKSYSLFTQGAAGPVNLNDFKNKVCFIGLTATGTHDLNPVPIQKRYPGLGIHVNLFNTIVTQNFLRRAGKTTNLLILIISAFLVWFVTLRMRPLASSLIVISVLAFLCVVAAALFIFAMVWIDIFYPLVALFILYLAMTFYKYVSERQKRQVIEKELEVARKIQQSFLPVKSPDIEWISVAADMLPAKQVGGDLYDFVELAGARFGVMVGDVSGKGVPASLYMARAVSLFRLFSKSGRDTKEVIGELNDALSEESAANLFVTLSYLIFDSKNNALRFSSGGHLPTILLKKEQEKCRLLETRDGLPLGLVSGNYTTEKTAVSTGDIVVLYTDGVTEAMNRHREEFGLERFTDLIEENRSLDPKELIEKIKSALFDFSGSSPQHDDITIIAIKMQ